MINEQVFREQLVRLALIYPGVSLSGPMIGEYYSILGDRLTTAEFVAACDRFRLAATQEFFPRPAQFLAADDEVEAAAEWSAAIAPSRWRYAPAGSYCDFEFSPRGRLAWQAMGGDARMRNVSDSEIDFRRAEFVRLYRQVTPEALARIEGPGYVLSHGKVADLESIGEQARRAIASRTLAPGDTDAEENER